MLQEQKATQAMENTNFTKADYITIDHEMLHRTYSC